MSAVAMIRVMFGFHGDLKDLLAPARRHGDFEHAAGSTDTAKHVIESLGVPHTEVGHIEVNGITASLDQAFQDADRLDVYPPAPGEALVDPRFVLDGHLGRLAAYLRMLGLDVWYRALADDVELASVCASDRRVLLTRDVGLLKRKEVDRGYLVRADRPRDQLREVARRYRLEPHILPFSRCMSCNGLLERVSKEEVLESLPPHTRATKEEFSRCTACGKVYWKGSHHARMQQWVTELLCLPGTDPPVS